MYNARPSGFYDAPPPQQHQQQQPPMPSLGAPSGFEQPNLSFYSPGPAVGGNGNGMGYDMSGMGGMNGGVDGGMLGGQMSAQIGSGSGGGFEDEPPLMEELGINFADIRTRMLYVLLPFKSPAGKALEDTDLAGPVLFAMALGISLMLTGKIQFGFIYGTSALGCMAIWAILNVMHEQGIDMYRVCSVLGYGLVPIVLLSLVNVGISLKGRLGLLLSALCIFWCAYSAARFFERILDLSEQRWLIAYPLCLLYACFALITVF